MPSAQTTADYVRHECGHLVVARSLGFPTGRIKLTGKDASAQITLLPSIQSLDDLKRFIERRVQVLFAGAMAQSLRGRKGNSDDANEFLRTTANQDYAKARELVRLHTGVERANATEDRFGAKLEQTDKRIYERAGKAVEKYASAILDLSAAFMDAWRKADSPAEFEYSADKIDQVLKAHDL